jgi:hypothetical protein
MRARSYHASPGEITSVGGLYATVVANWAYMSASRDNAQGLGERRLGGGDPSDQAICRWPGGVLGIGSRKPESVLQLVRYFYVTVVQRQKASVSARKLGA